MGIRVVVKHALLILNWPSFVNFKIFKILRFALWPDLSKNQKIFYNYA